ncbi:MAG: UDP-N-acetylmuramoyl-tripeptide--D-alanyl-D-alanine ligase [Planctomycetota bacterium]|jgi:UDP-N-acetylmuramoyl-tripeptide--D-alanyl-D-alanine ligase
MNEFSITTLAEIISADIENTSSQHSFVGVSTDTRTIEPGQCFFAIKGEYLDGADYLDDAFDKGVACVVVNENTDTSRFPAEKILKVQDSLKALGDFAHWYRNRHDFKVIAITGSVGKTTTKNIVHHIISKHFRTYQAPKNYNTLTGLPLSILDSDPKDEILVLELGTNSSGEIAALSKIASPDIALITTVQPSHLEGFGSLENIAEEKTSITQSLKDNGPLIINADCPILISTCQNKDLKFLTFGKSPNVDFRAENITFNDTSSTFTIQNTTMHLPIPGLGAVENTIAAWAVCSQLEIKAQDFADALKNTPPVTMRTQIIKISDLIVINDCYNANPASMKNAIDILANFNRTENQRLVFICGDMAELGDQEQKLHAELGKYIAGSGIDLIVAVGPLAQTAAENATSLAQHNLQIKFCPDVLSACNNLTNYINHDDIILVKGSRVAKLELIVEKIKNVFEIQKR